jgi:cytochrome c oxidase cbb3-type subunit 1
MMAAMSSAGVVALGNDVFLDRGLIRAWLAWGLVWLLVFSTLGAILAVQFTDPNILDGVSWLSYGRLFPVHVNGVIWGAFSTLFIGLAHYVVPRLCGARLWLAGCSRPLLWLWNLNVAAGSVLLLRGDNRGWAAGEYPLPTVIVALFVLAALTLQFLVTVGRRPAPPLYVSLWYLIAAFGWTDVTLALLILGPPHIAGLDSAAWHGLFLQSLVGLWITPAGYVLVYYFLPASIRTPIFSHRLALVGVWWLAFVGPLAGVYRYLYVSAMADWTKTVAFVSAMVLLVPAGTVLPNVFATVRGARGGLRGNVPAKLLVTGTLMFLVVCARDAAETLRGLQQPPHISDVVVTEVHVMVLTTVVLWALAGVLYVWPRITEPAGAGVALATWGYRLLTLGVVALVVVLTLQRLQQEGMLITGTDWVDTLDAVRPYGWMRAVTGVVMGLGLSCLVLHLAGNARRP